MGIECRFLVGRERMIEDVMQTYDIRPFKHGSQALSNCRFSEEFAVPTVLNHINQSIAVSSAVELETLIKIALGTVVELQII